MNICDREKMIAANRHEYGRYYDFLTFPSAAQCVAADRERSALLAWLRTHAVFGCNDTKVDCQGLAPGCRACAAGGWSCLFINGRCNAACFYCPTPQDDIGDPLTNGIPFAASEDYAEYVARFGFSGASISGGEPLLTLDRTLAYLSAVRQRCGDAVHLWLYTNGTLLTRESAAALRAAGLDEIRFDIGATSYNLTKLQLAVGVIPTVTVEIPAVPEDEVLMQEKLRELAAIGVQHVNLHQLRLTPHNFRHLANRDYTFIHGEKVTVLESELAALRLVRYAIEQVVGLPVNYCSFPYKRRFQHAAARRRGIPFVQMSTEDATEAGYLRSIVDGMVQYHEAVTLAAASNRFPVTELPLPSGRRIVVEKRPVSPAIPLSPGYDRPPFSPVTLPPELHSFEWIPSGFADYF